MRSIVLQEFKDLVTTSSHVKHQTSDVGQDPDDPRVNEDIQELLHNEVLSVQIVFVGYTCVLAARWKR